MFLAVNIFVFDVALGVIVDGHLINGLQTALDFARVADDQAARRNVRFLQDEGSGGNDAARANFYAVQNDRTHADETTRGDHATVQRDGVPDGDVVAEDKRVLVTHDVEH